MKSRNSISLSKNPDQQEYVLVERTLLKSMQTDIIQATQLISSLREEKERMNENLKQISKENEENRARIRNLISKLVKVESCDTDEVIKELNQAKNRLKFEMQKSSQEINQESPLEIQEILTQSKVFLKKVHENTKEYKIFKSHMRSTHFFKHIINTENWLECSLMLFKYLNTFLKSLSLSQIKVLQTEASSESEAEDYSKIIRQSHSLLNHLTSQKSRLETLNFQMTSQKKEKIRAQTTEPESRHL